MASKKRLPSNLIMLIFVAALIIFVAAGIPRYTGQTLIGALILLAVLLYAEYALFRAGRKKDTRQLIGAEIYEDKKTREKNRAAGVTTFSLAFQDGSHELVTVKDTSPEYAEYKALGPAPK